MLRNLRDSLAPNSTPTNMIQSHVVVDGVEEQAIPVVTAQRKMLYVTPAQNQDISSQYA